MKIGYIAGAYIPSKEADSMHVVRMCQAFADLGHEVCMHARRGYSGVADDFTHYGVRENFRIEKYHRPQIRVYGALANARSVAQGVKRSALPDVFYSREPYGLAMLASTGVPYVYESHWRPKHFVHERLEGWLFRQPNFARLVLISDALRRLYEDVYPWLPKSSIVVAHDAADSAGDLPRLPRATSRFQIGYVGGFLPGYGIAKIAEVAEIMRDADFHVVGGRDEVVKKWRKDTRRISNLTFHGFVAPKDLALRYAGFDVVLAPYQEGTAHIRWISPMKLFEYMAHGRAIVCSDFPVMREVLRQGENALLVPPADTNAWVEAIGSLRDSKLREKLGSNARAELESRHTWLNRAERVLECLPISANRNSR